MTPQICLVKVNFGNILTRYVFKLVSGKNVYDTQTGLRGIPFSLLQKFLEIKGSRYEYEINMLLYCAQNNIEISELPITTIYINNNVSSNFSVIKDSLIIYKCLLKNSKLLTLIMYTISSLIAFLIDYIILMETSKILFNYLNSHLALLISVIIARIFSSFFNFMFNKNIVFENNASFFKSFTKYYSLVGINLVFNYCMLDILNIFLNINLSIAKIIVETFIFILNFFIQKKFIFKFEITKSN